MPTSESVQNTVGGNGELLATDQQQAELQQEDLVVVNSLQWSYPGATQPVVSDFSLRLPRGSRCLLLGANGAGKSTLLQLLAGKHMIPPQVVRVLHRPAFHDIALTSTGALSYLGPQWRRDTASAGYDMPLQGDITAQKMIFGVEGIDPARRKRLIKFLDVDLGWRMNRVSAGQRRRVQICLGLLKPYQVLLLDEITVDMDVVGRLDLLQFFREECEHRGATIIYATHIFDGLEGWITHLAHVADGKLVRGGRVEEVAGLRQGKLLHKVEGWLREDREARGGKEAAARDQQQGRGVQPTPQQSPLTNRHMAFYR